MLPSLVPLLLPSCKALYFLGRSIKNEIDLNCEIWSTVVKLIVLTNLALLLLQNEFSLLLLQKLLIIYFLAKLLGI